MFFYANPAPEAVDSRCDLNTTDTPYSYVVMIHIENVTDEDFGEHECIVKNELGHTALRVELKDTDSKFSFYAITFCLIQL